MIKLETNIEISFLSNSNHFHSNSLRTNKLSIIIIIIYLIYVLTSKRAQNHIHLTLFKLRNFLTKTTFVTHNGI